jgi:uncharacterized protein DUF3551
MRNLVTFAATLGVLMLTAGAVNAQSRGGYCLKETFGASNCSFHTLAQCVASKIGNADACVPH